MKWILLVFLAIVLVGCAPTQPGLVAVSISGQDQNGKELLISKILDSNGNQVLTPLVIMEIIPGEDGFPDYREWTFLYEKDNQSIEGIVVDGEQMIGYYNLVVAFKLP